MSLTPSTMLELGTTAPDFTLHAPDGSRFSLGEQSVDKGLLVVFMCNHCPYVMYIRDQLVDMIKYYQSRGLSAVAINSNDYLAYPADGPEQMRVHIEQYGYSFPYLIDTDQTVARAYRAACTPDLFLFDHDRRLVYRGQFDGARPGNTIPVTGGDLGAAVEALLAGTPIPPEQVPSSGCNIKWRPGNEPDYFQRPPGTGK